ncbi:MAG TPA: ABC transporter permease [Alphaproteobacteria bacterium]|nr:ABC transporter permease [Alphaproteobacteria bacterium]
MRLDPESRAVRWAIFAASVLVGAAFWQFGARHVNPAVAVPLTATIERLVELTKSGELLGALWSSLVLFGTGLGLAIVAALPLGLVLARARRLRIAFTDYITLLYALPTVALIPFILSLFGIDFSAKVLVVFLFAFFAVLYNTVEGARSIRPELIEVARSFRSPEWALWRDVLIPATLPYAMTGIRQAIGRALVGMVAAQFFLAASGIGELIMNSARDFDTGALLGSVLIIALLGVVLMRLGTALENRFTAWRGLGR